MLVHFWKLQECQAGLSLVVSNYFHVQFLDRMSRDGNHEMRLRLQKPASFQFLWELKSALTRVVTLVDVSYTWLKCTNYWQERNRSITNSSSHQQTCHMISEDTRKKLAKGRSRLDSRKFVFSQRVVNRWNGLPAKVVNTESVNSFKNAYDRYCCEDMDDRSWSAAGPLSYK